MAAHPGAGLRSSQLPHLRPLTAVRRGLLTNESGALRTPRGRRTTGECDSPPAGRFVHATHKRREYRRHRLDETDLARCSSSRRRRSDRHCSPNIDTVRLAMVHQTSARSLSATIARHHWGSRLRIVLHVGTDEHFVLLSSANGATSIHVAIDEHGNIGGDWWGQADGECPTTALQLFAERHQLPVSELLSAVRQLDTLTPTLPAAATRNRISEPLPEMWQRLLAPTTTRGAAPSKDYPSDEEHVVAAIAVSGANQP
jgi:hypothetical protein